MDIPTLIVDDQADIRLLIRLLIERAGDGLAVVAEASSGAEALDRVNDCDPLVVVLDQMMPDMNGVETAAHIRALRPDQILILSSGSVSDDLIERARAVGITNFISKDHLRALPELIRRAVRMAT